MLTELIAAAIAAPSADNSQPWRLEWDGRELAVGHRPPQGPDPFGAGGHAGLLAIGHVVANIAAFLESARIHHGVRWPAQPEHGTPYVTVEFAEPPRTAGSRAGRPVLRHTNRFPFSPAEIPADARRMVATATRNPARAVVSDSADARSALAAIVERCSEARFCTRELHEWLMASLRFTPEAAARGDGLDLRTLHLPPGGDAFLRLTADWRVMRQLNRLGIYRMLAAGETALLRSAPMLVCIVGTADPAGTLAAGALLARLWVDLNALGIAVHPYYVVADQQFRLETNRVPADWRDPVGEAVSRVRTLLELAPDERLHMILRVGWPTVAPRRSLRLPLDAVFRDLTGAATG